MTSEIRIGRLLTAGLVAGLIMNIGEAALHAEYLETRLRLPMRR